MKIKDFVSRMSINYQYLLIIIKTIKIENNEIYDIEEIKINQKVDQLWILLTKPPAASRIADPFLSLLYSERATPPNQFNSLKALKVQSPIVPGLTYPLCVVLVIVFPRTNL